ncbi:hypothetical protein O9K51_00679 [Purpureocillium lavendulum]|uniref:BTB domain-containing protein n=1 Tax=Purpureocillium lavendulum TaxID=1247861 RepID=A0AB34G371_9HYPO|nr:hypothetical protein O9K51_00679 [Purpureocillium lavendulum]
MVPIERTRAYRQPSDGYIRSSLDKSLPPPPPSAADMTTVLIGAKQQSFKVNRKLLCAVSPFFRERLEDPVAPKPICLWLPGESSTMFALFVEWVHSPTTFRSWLDHSVSTAHETSQRASQDIHWAIVRLHLFAAHLDLFKLQDLAMDAIQDLYLKYDWDVPPRLILYLYTQCEAVQAVRIRRWAVAMVAFSLTVGPNQLLKFHPQDATTSDPARFRALFDTLHEFAADYSMHLHNMKAAGLDVRFKNPQLRISANKLRNDQRLFGFRECSFHSHRAAVGEKRCPHVGARVRSRHASELGASAVVDMDRRRVLHADAVPRPLFSSHGDENDERPAKHMRTASGSPKG